MTKAEEANEFREVILKEGTGLPNVMDWCDKIMKCARLARHYAVAACNYELSKRQISRGESNDSKIESLAKVAGFKAITRGDPRGYVVKLLLKSGRYNTWGGAEHGFGVPDPA